MDLLIPFGFQLHSLHSLDTTIINDPDYPIDFILGGAKNFPIGGGMHSPSSCFKLLLVSSPNPRHCLCLVQCTVSHLFLELSMKMCFDAL